MIYPNRQVTLRSRIPTVRVHVVMDDGEVELRARWKDRPIDLQRRISYLMRQGKAIFLENEWGRTVCLSPERVQGATVDGRVAFPGAVEAAGPVRGRDGGTHATLSRR